MRRSALTFAAFALVAVSCGGDDQPGRSVTVPADGSVGVVAREYSFDPSVIVVRAPGTLRLTLRNEGSLAHNLKLLSDGREVGGTPSFPGGRSESVRLTVLPGDYELVCTVGDHAELGMKGTLKVD